MTRTVGIYLFDGMEVLDFAGPYEVFAAAAHVHSRLSPGSPAAFSIITIAGQPGTVEARGGLVIQPGYDISRHPAVDVLVVPGGIVSAETRRDEVIAWVRETARAATIAASVCSGAFFLARAGLLDGKRATTHWADIDELASGYPRIAVQRDTRWVDLGQIVTSAGVSAGIDMSLHLVSRLAGEELAAQTARNMEYHWRSKP
jgi:transcriptional regulator GlxA family with amidase domain